MGKRKGQRGGKLPKPALQNAASSDEEENALEAVLDDEIDKYNASRDQELLKKDKKSGRKKKNITEGEESEEEVYGLNLDVSDDEEDVIDDGSDIDDTGDIGAGEESDDDDDDEDIYGDERQDGVPDERAWGKRARVFHSTDYVDQDFGGMDGEDAMQAELEEKEAIEIQKKLTAELDDADFMDFIPTVVPNQKQVKEVDSGEALKLDVSKLTPSEVKKLVAKHCPEVEFLLQDCQEKLGEVEKIRNLLATEDMNEVSKQYYSTRFHTLSNYCINVTYFLYLRGSNPAEASGHPVVKKIMQYRRLLEELDEMDVKRFRTLPVSLESIPMDMPVKDRRKTRADPNVPDASQEEADEFGEEDALGKRKITYKMEKNKGLLPKRQKEQRNPRVKHREKFRKAKIRRKGQVPNARTETTRYDGEMFGIKSNLSKSVKFK